MRLVLLHSPLVGAGTWDVLAPLLRARGHDVLVPDLAAVMQGAPPYYPKLAAAVAGIAENSVLIAHSGAGALVPEMARQARIRGAVFVDALLPHPGKSWFETAPAALQARLRGLARDGRLPPWHLWWPKGAIETLLPDAAVHERFVAGLGNLPLSYFEERAPEAELRWSCAYLQWSESYNQEADWAKTAGWAVVHQPLHHLAMLTHAEAVMPEIERLAAAF